MSPIAFRLSTVAAAAAAAFATLACASAVSAAPIVSTSSLPLTSSVAGIVIGDGVHQSNAQVTTFQAGKTPLVGVGALSGSPQHDGSVASVSVLNTNSLLGVNLGPGPGSAGSVNVANPTGKPVLSGLIK